MAARVASRTWHLAAIAALALLWSSSAPANAARVVAVSANVAAAEARVAAAPDDAAALAALAERYVAEGAPGLALAAIAGATPAARADEAVLTASARAWLAEGQSAEALAASRRAVAACEAHGCAAWRAARAETVASYCEALVDAGIDDPVANPDSARRAWSRAAREIRLAVR